MQPPQRDPSWPSRDQKVQQIGTIVEQDGDTRSVIMPECQRANWLRWLLEVSQLDCRVARLAVQNDHAANAPHDATGRPHIGFMVIMKMARSPRAVGHREEVAT